MIPLRRALVLSLVVAASACGARQGVRPTPFVERAGFWAKTPSEGFVWFFPAVDERARNDQQFDRITDTVPGVSNEPLWFAPVRITLRDAHHAHAYGDGYGPRGTWLGPYGVAISGNPPSLELSVMVRNQSIAALGLGRDCPVPPAFPVAAESFTVVEVDSVFSRKELASSRYCPSVSVLGTVSFSRGSEATHRAMMVAASAEHPSLRIAALEAVVRGVASPDSSQIRALFQQIARNDPSRRVRGYARVRLP